MKSIKIDVDAGYGYNANVAPATLLMAVKQLYTYILRRNEWSKVDPRDAQILALTTALEKQPSKQSHGSGGYSGSGYSGSKEETIRGINSLKKWRTINKYPTLIKMVLIITGASTVSMRFATMVYITIITLRPHMSNGRKRNVEDERQRPQVQIQQHPHHQWSPT